jgi:hypothetical protein
MGRHYKTDFERGTAAQHEIFPIVKEFFKDSNLQGELRENPERFAKYDYECDDAVFEVKTRFDINRNTYNTTMITCNKVTEIDKAIIFIFNFTDEISWIQYDEDIFKNFEKKLFSRAKMVSEEEDTFYIPIEHLQTIHIKPSKCLLKMKK